MDNNIPAPDREELRSLLLSWQRGAMTFYETADEAEAIEQRTWQNIDVIEFAEDDPRRISTEVVSLLSMGHVAPLFVEDIPFLLDCLDAFSGSEERHIAELWHHLGRWSADERWELAQERYANAKVG